MPWRPSGFSGPDPTVCAGYTTNLPEVQEIARAHLHWKNGALVPWLQGRPASPELMNGIEFIESEVSKFESWSLEEAAKNRRQQ